MQNVVALKYHLYIKLYIQWNLSIVSVELFSILVLDLAKLDTLS